MFNVFNTVNLNNYQNNQSSAPGRDGERAPDRLRPGAPGVRPVPGAAGVQVAVLGGTRDRGTGTGLQSRCHADTLRAGGTLLPALSLLALVPGPEIPSRSSRARTREAAPSVSSVTWTDILQDLRLALRALWRSPMATGLAMVCLALGIGTNATMFSVVSGTLLDPLPFRDPGQLVTIWIDAT